MNDRGIFAQQVAQLLLHAVPAQVRMAPKPCASICALPLFHISNLLGWLAPHYSLFAPFLLFFILGLTTARFFSLVRTLCAKFTDIVADSKEPIKGVEPLRRAIDAVAPSPYAPTSFSCSCRLQRSFRRLGLVLVVVIRKMEPRFFSFEAACAVDFLLLTRLDCISRNHIVPQHWMLAQISILSKSYNYAVAAFDSAPFHIDADATAVDARDVRLFFYYGGICYLGMKRWTDAVEWFKAVIAAPAIVPSAIQVEAYRKYVLASLLASGSVESAPRYTNPQLLRHLKQLSQPYDELATAYGTHSTDDVHKCAEVNHDTFRKDANFGLVKQVIKSLYRRNIQRLTKTYLTLSLEDIAKQVKLPNTADAERLILQCIEKGEIFATISQKDGNVSFQENPEQYNSTQTLQLLDSNLKRTLELLSVLQSTEENVSLSSKYLEKIVSADRGSGAGRWPGAGADMDDMDVAPLDRPQGMRV